MAGIITSQLGGMSSLTGAFQNRTASRQTEAGTSFSSVLSDALENYRQVDNEGDMATFDLLTGGTNDLSDTLIATEKAEIALNLTVAVRNKAIDAYKEIMNMQV